MVDSGPSPPISPTVAMGISLLDAHESRTTRRPDRMTEQEPFSLLRDAGFECHVALMRLGMNLLFTIGVVARVDAPAQPGAPLVARFAVPVRVILTPSALRERFVTDADSTAPADGSVRDLARDAYLRVSGRMFQPAARTLASAE